MEIEFLAHASVVIRAGRLVLLTDPWFTGKAFNDSWALHPAPAIDWARLDDVTHVWISHEHPDHFSIPTLRAFPEDLRKRVTVLFQSRNTEKIADALHRLGFPNVEMLPNRRVIHINDVDVYCYPTHLGDSCLGVRQGLQSVFNVNDAELDTVDAARIVRDFGTPDVVLNQFSLAGYQGYRERERYLPRFAEDKLRRILDNHLQLGAAITIPFASYIYFCREDNAYINAYANTPGGTVNHLRAHGGEALLLRPGQRYTVGEDTAPFEENLPFYERVVAEIPSLPLEPSEPVSREALFAAWDKFARRLQDSMSPWVLRWVPDVTFWVEDLGLALRASPRHGTLAEARLPKDECGVWVNAQPLWFGFEYPYGLETLGVSARYLVNRDFRAWKILKNLSILNNQEVHLTARFLWSRRNRAYLIDRLRGGLLRQIVRKSWRGLRLRGRAA